MVEQLLEEEGGISLRDLTAREGAKRIISLSSPYSSSSVGETAGRTSTRTSSWLLALSSSHYYFLVTILPFLHSPESWTCSLSLSLFLPLTSIAVNEQSVWRALASLLDFLLKSICVILSWSLQISSVSQEHSAGVCLSCWCCWSPNFGIRFLDLFLFIYRLSFCGFFFHLTLLLSFLFFLYFLWSNLWSNHCWSVRDSVSWLILNSIRVFTLSCLLDEVLHSLLQL